MFRMGPELPSFSVSMEIKDCRDNYDVKKKTNFSLLTSNETASFAGILETIPNIGVSAEFDFSNRVNRRFAVRGSK